MTPWLPVIGQTSLRIYADARRRIVHLSTIHFGALFVVRLSEANKTSHITLLFEATCLPCVMSRHLAQVFRTDWFSGRPETTAIKATPRGVTDMVVVAEETEAETEITPAPALLAGYVHPLTGPDAHRQLTTALSNAEQGVTSVGTSYFLDYQTVDGQEVGLSFTRAG